MLILYDFNMLTLNGVGGGSNSFANIHVTLGVLYMSYGCSSILLLSLVLFIFIYVKSLYSLYTEISFGIEPHQEKTNIFHL